MKATHRGHGLTREVLERLYCQENKSDMAIGEMFGLSDAGVTYYRRKFGIATRTALEKLSAKAVSVGLRDLSGVSDEELVALYRKHGCVVLGRMFGCSKIPIRERLSKLGVQAISKQARQRAQFPDALSDEQKQLLVGSLLGDGNMHINKAGDSARFKEAHCLRQKAYLTWKQTILLPFAYRIRPENKRLQDGRIAEGCVFVTCFHPVFVPAYRSFYREDGVKVLPSGLMETITPFSLAVWYMDDGHLADATADGIFTLASAFPEAEVASIAETLNSRFCLDIEPRWSPDSSLFILWIHNKDKFFDVVGKHIHPSMSYKVPVSLRFRLPHVNKPHLWDALDRFSKANWAGVDAERERWADDLTDYWQVAGFPYPTYRKKERMLEVSAVKNSDLLLEGQVASGNNVGAGLCVSFFDEFWEAKRYGKRSPMDVFRDRKLLRETVKACLVHRRNADASALRSELQTWGGVHNFRPAVAKAVIEKYGGEGSVLDPCAGWGGRLLGFYCSNRGRRYVGIDANPETVKGLRHMRCVLGRDVPDKAVELEYAAFEDWEATEQFDLVFTSPPYFKKEWYCGDDKQSDVRYPEYTAWKDSFLRPLIEKSAARLKPGGFFVLNIDNVKLGAQEYPVGDDAASIAGGVLELRDTHWMVGRNLFNGNETKEPLLVYRKCE